MSEPLVIEGFYRTRVFGRRILRAMIVTALVATSLALAVGVSIVALINFFLISWGLS